ncbi:hypothetical protein MA16_Dca017372 [Dendrobium catenatum]|uniref:Uncharacterized protein n=1 Tax=Dendrobium catenatum TaxID=906689 RepID=A0A2I0VRL9_9ASPA|nr:hypothetical protein MA16_Dca017372 [Dendrobium catenatum]
MLVHRSFDLYFLLVVGYCRAMMWLGLASPSSWLVATFGGHPLLGWFGCFALVVTKLDGLSSAFGKLEAPANY